MSLKSGTPFVVIHSAPLVWTVSDVYSLDPKALDGYCARFKRWDVFFGPMVHNDKVPPLYPPEILPGTHRILSIMDMFLLEGIWYVKLRIETSMSLADVQCNDDIRPWVVKDLRTKRWPGFL